MLKDELKISIHNLDKAALDHASNYADWAEKWAEAVQEKDTAKEELEIKKAEVDEKARKTPYNYGWEKGEKAPTADWVKAVVARDEGVKKLSQALIKAQYNVNIMLVAKEAFEHQRKMLEILTNLYINNYMVIKSRTNFDYQEQLHKINQEKQGDKLENSLKLRKKSC